MRTSVEIPDSLLKRAKGYARRNRITLRALILEGLRSVLAHEQSSPPRFRLEDLSVGESGLVEGLSPTDWDEIRNRSYEGRGG